MFQLGVQKTVPLYKIIAYDFSLTNSEFAICHVVRHGNVNSIQNPSTVTNPTMEPYNSFLLPLTLPCRTVGLQRDKSQTHKSLF